MKFIITYLFCFVSLCVCAQIDTISAYPNSLFFYHDIEDKGSLIDTMQIDKVNLYPYSNRTTNRYFQNMGELGLATKSLEAPVFHKSSSQFYLPGYEWYWKSLDSLRFYKLQKQYTHAYFTQSGGADDVIIDVDYGRNFANKYGLGITYSRLKNTGYFQHQNSEHTNLGISNWYIPKSDKYVMYLKGMFNTIAQQENWGLLDTVNALSNSDISPLSVTRFNDDAFLRSRRFNGEFKHSLTLPIGKFTHSFEYWNNRIEYDDTGINNPSDYSIYLSDTAAEQHRIVNESHVTNSVSYTEPVLGTEMGIFLKSYNYRLGNFKEKNNSFGAYAKQDFFIDSLISVNASGNLEMIDSKSDLLLTASTSLEGKVSVSIDASYKNGLPSIIYRRIVVSDTMDNFQFYNDNLDNTKVFDLSARTSYETKFVDFQLGGSIKSYGDYVYLDTTQSVVQDDKTRVLTSIDGEVDLHYKSFHLDNQIRLHSGDDHFFRIPSYIYTGTLYYHDYWFKKRLNTVIGVRTRYVPEHKGQQYFPLLSTFYHSDETLDENINLDVFINFKVERFKLFFEMEDVLHGENNYQHIDSRYVMEASKFRFGVAWGWLE